MLHEKQLTCDCGWESAWLSIEEFDARVNAMMEEHRRSKHRIPPFTVFERLS